MGKWTSDYYDHVLNTKIKSLVSGAIKRARLEKNEPTISYENFVEDLDAGDSFTSTIIDCLVKELADRRRRPSASDRRLIAECTANNLRTLSSPFRIYCGRSRRSSSSRRTDYIASSPHEIEPDDDEEIYMDSLNAEGETITSDGPRVDMFDPPALMSNSLMRPGSPVPVTGSDENSSLATYSSLSSSGWPRSSTHLHNVGAVLSRHPTVTVRRPSRSRTVDFNDFTSFSSRRRTSFRDSLSSHLEPEPSSSSSSAQDREASRENIYIRPTRRFFPPAGFRHSRNREGDFNVWTDLAESEETEDRLNMFMPSWVPMASSPPADGIGIDAAETSNERSAVGPRLRRGGVRAPESMLSRHVSPVTIRASGGIFSPPPPGLSTSTSAPTSVPGSPRLTAEPVSYPTPASGDEHENLS
ncbi:hypothetical protein D9758_004877 [Tetrapyrgos nigripes]|uniref:Uncharacterized protein n=1 Tax=Tetrapyrgos nigripes TaxID=182062 RepID=A0A8H5G674_9AGAR|nr:hypothetical protein D9758_004877 [Tetrapyrgos nigripes]